MIFYPLPLLLSPLLSVYPSSMLPLLFSSLFLCLSHCFLWNQEDIDVLSYKPPRLLIYRSFSCCVNPVWMRIVPWTHTFACLVLSWWTAWVRRCDLVGGSVSLWGWALRSPMLMLCPVWKESLSLAVFGSRCRSLISSSTMCTCTLACFLL